MTDLTISGLRALLDADEGAVGSRLVSLTVAVGLLRDLLDVAAEREELESELDEERRNAADYRRQHAERTREAELAADAARDALRLVERDRVEALRRVAALEAAAADTADSTTPDVGALTELLADLDRDPDGYTVKGTIAAMVRSCWPGAPAGPPEWEPCECGCTEADNCPCDDPEPSRTGTPPEATP